MENNILILGDLCPTADTKDKFSKANPASLFNDVLPLLKNSQFVLANLEFVLTDNPLAAKKTGPILYGPTTYCNILKNSQIDLLSLANNHVKDCGEDGVKSSLETIAKVGIATVGAGRNLIEAKKPFIKEIDGKKIAFLSFAEQEFNTATENEYGANYFDPYEDLDLITDIKKHVDHLIILYHGGIEHYTFPSPLLQKRCRRFIDKGADLVTCQHSHCIGSIEVYHGKSIVYGQGNTIFGYRAGDASWNQGLILNVQFDGADLKLSYRGVQAIKEGGIRLLSDNENIKLLEELEQRSKFLNDPIFIKESWRKFCKKKESLYLPQYLALSRYFIHLNRLTNNKFVSIFFGKKNLRASHNIIRCEAHNEVIQTILKAQTKE